MSCETTTNVNGQVVVVTGASGFIGHHVVRLLISDDQDVSIIRCLDIEPQSKVKESIIQKELDKCDMLLTKTYSKKIEWIHGDIRDINVVEKCLAGADCVIHCAARIETSVYYDDQNEEELESVNVKGTETLLKASIRLAVPKFIHVSSFEAWLGYEMIYYATENTKPIPRCLLFGASGSTKKQAVDIVKQFSNSKLKKKAKNGRDSLNAVIIELPPTYGEFDQHYITYILKVAKHFGNKLQRVSNVWTRQQPLYVGNAAWSIISAKKKMDIDSSISGEEFIITDDTKILDPFDFLTPYLECKGMSVTTRSYPYLPLWIVMMFFFFVIKLVKSIGLSNLQERRDENMDNIKYMKKTIFHKSRDGKADKVWYKMINPQLLTLMSVTWFFNRAKSSLRLDYEPKFTPQESQKRSIEWYEKHCAI